MRSIRIDDEVWAALQKRARAFEDTPNSVLRRILHLDRTNKRGDHSNRTPRGMKTPERAFREPILRALYELGGSGQISEILEKVYVLIRDKLKEVDHQRLASGEIRWRNTAQWERYNMVNEGLIKKNSPIGTWELTAKGTAAAKALMKSR
jgi:negative regulator of replication initiation